MQKGCHRGVGVGACSAQLAGRHAQAEEGGLLTGRWMAMQPNFNDLTVFPEPVLTIKETNLRAKVKTFVSPILFREQGCPGGEEAMREGADTLDV